MKCIRPDELRMFSFGGLDSDRSAAVRNHLSHCDRCLSAHQEMELMLKRLAFDEREFDDRALTQDVMNLVRLSAQPRRSALPWWRISRRRAESSSRPGATRRLQPLLLLPGVAVVAAIALWAVHPKHVPSGVLFQARGLVESADRWVSIQAFKKNDDAYIPANGLISPDAELAFAYTNRPPTEYRYLMVLGIDEKGEIYWYYPSNTGELDDKRSISIAATAAAAFLPYQIRHELPPGELLVLGVFSEEPLETSAMEAVVGEVFEAGVRLEDLEHLPLEKVGQHALRFQVVRERPRN